MFLRLTKTTKHGEPHQVLLAVNDISTVVPAPHHVDRAQAVVNLRSHPDYGVWVMEDVAEIDAALQHMGVDMAPHAKE